MNDERRSPLHWLRRSIQAVVALVLVTLVYRAISLWSAYSREKALAARLQAHGAFVRVEYRGPEWIPVDYQDKITVFDRIDDVDMMFRSRKQDVLPDELIGDIRSLRYAASVALTWSGDTHGQLSRLGGTPVTTLAFESTSISDEDLQALSRLPRLRGIRMYRISNADRTLRHISRLQGLEAIDLSQSDVTDGGLQQIAECTNLKRLKLLATAITDRGISELSSLANLEILWLDHAIITDASLPTLQGLPKLRGLIVFDARGEDIDKLRQRLPSCEVIDGKDF